MLTLMMSALILLVPIVVVGLLLVAALRAGKYGFLCVLLAITCVAAKGYCMVYPTEDLSDKYARLLRI